MAEVRCPPPPDFDLRSVRHSMAPPRPRSGLVRADPQSQRFCTPGRRAASTCPPKPRVGGRHPLQVRGRLLSTRSLVPHLRSHTEGSRAAASGGEECGSEARLAPGDIDQFFLHGCANRVPRTAHGPLIYGGEWPHNCGSELREPSRRVDGNLQIEHDPASASGEGCGAVGDDLCARGHLRQGVRGQDRVRANRRSARRP